MEEQFDLAVAEFVLAKMSEHIDAGSVITRLLEMVGEKFGLHHIAIVEKGRDAAGFATTYEYCSPDCPAMLNQTLYCAEREWQNDIRCFENTNMLYFESGAANESQSMLRNISKNTGGAFCAAILEHRPNCEAALLFHFSEKHAFTQEEKKAFSMVRDMIDLYLLPVRDYEKDRAELKRVKMYDSVTGLMKYENFINVAEQLYRSDRTDTRYAVVYADISNFKYVNEYYGYTAGDDILRRFEQFFISGNSAELIGCRLFSDYFIALAKIDDCAAKPQIIAAVEKMSKQFSEMVKQIYPEAKVNVVSGISIITDKQTGIVNYIDRANTARKQTKKKLSDCCMIYDESMEIQLKKEIEISSKAEEALFIGEFTFELQPKINLDNGEVIGAEALVRWTKSDGTKFFPDQFIPVFEKNGFITKLDYMVYNEVCRYLGKRLQNGEKIVPVSVNVSRVHFDKEDFVEQVIELVDTYQVPHQYLEFEITESVFIEQMSKAKTAIKELRRAGFLVSMDDFGSGYSSLNLLRELDFDVLKLDKEFLADGTLDRKEAVIISNVINMAKQMNITVLCEGVETKEQANFLAEAECDLVQGYYYGRPMTVEEFNQLLAGTVQGKDCFKEYA